MKLVKVCCLGIGFYLLFSGIVFADELNWDRVNGGWGYGCWGSERRNDAQRFHDGFISKMEMDRWRVERERERVRDSRRVLPPAYRIMPDGAGGFVVIPVR